ncbi:MAG: hypothetical protein K9L78_05250 [Victivallales bacterium]|nr:hypothetical protein [Victivallales bacterium]MCF7889508.1 hypothetical protein [Victivallales bacterium]
MKKKLLISFALLCSLLLSGLHAENKTNDFYDDAEKQNLKTNSIKVTGEVETPYTVDFSRLPERSVIVRETVLKDGKAKFIGAYKYTGYSLYDIMNSAGIKKAKGNTYNPFIELYLVIENAVGEKTVVTWAEIYYANNRYKNIIATEVTPVLPSFSDAEWPIPEKMKLVIGKDLLSERNIDSPNKITLKSLNIQDVDTSKKPSSFCPAFKIRKDGKQIGNITQFPSYYSQYNYPTVFFGHGRGFHGIHGFSGVPLQYVLKPFFPVNKENIKTGLFSIVAADGYYAAFSYSEIVNRNDQSYILLIDEGKTKIGKFRLFPSCDFFADRSIKCLSEIRFKNN